MAQGKKEQPAPLRGRRRWARGSACTRRGTTGSSDEPKTGDGGGEGKGYLVGGDSGCNERCAPRGKHCTLHSTPGAAPPTLWAPAACNLCEIRIYTIGLLGALWPIFWCGTVKPACGRWGHEARMDSECTHSSSRRKRHRRSRSTCYPGWRACGARRVRSPGPQRPPWCSYWP